MSSPLISGEAGAARSAVPSDARPSFAARYALITLIALTLLNYLDKVVLVVGTEPMRRALGLNDLQLGKVQGLGISLAGALGGIPLAWLADRYDRRWVLAACIVLWSSFTTLRAFAGGFAEILASTAGMAVAEAALIPIAYAVLPALYSGRHLARANIIFYAAGALGYPLAMTVTGGLFKLVEQHLASLPDFLARMESWRSVSFLVGVAGPVFALMALGIEKQKRAPPGKDVESVESIDAEKQPTVEEYIRVSWRALTGTFGAISFVAIGFTPMLAWLAPAVARRFGSTPAEVGSQIGTLFVAATLLGLLLSWAFQRVLETKDQALVPLKVAPILCLIAAISAASLVFATSSTAVYAFVFVLITALVSFNAGMPLIYQTLLPAPLRASLSAVFISVLTAFSSASPVAVGYISDKFAGNNSAVFIAMAAIGAPALLFASYLLRAFRVHVNAAIATAGTRPS
jgi:MFS family permease